jgi:hypothetical protein
VPFEVQTFIPLTSPLIDGTLKQRHTLVTVSNGDVGANPCIRYTQFTNILENKNRFFIFIKLKIQFFIDSTFEVFSKP